MQRRWSIDKQLEASSLEELALVSLDPGTLNPQLRQLCAQIIAYRILAGIQPLPPKSHMAVNGGPQLAASPD